MHDQEKLTPGLSRQPQEGRSRQSQEGSGQGETSRTPRSIPKGIWEMSKEVVNIGNSNRDKTSVAMAMASVINQEDMKMRVVLTYTGWLLLLGTRSAAGHRIRTVKGPAARRPWSRRPASFRGAGSRQIELLTFFSSWATTFC